MKLVDISITDECSCTVRTWMLEMDDMLWVMDCTINVDELWAQTPWKGLPRVDLWHPVVSIADCNVSSFLVCEGRAQWLTMVDMKSRTVQSASRCPNRDGTASTEILAFALCHCVLLEFFSWN